VAATQFIEICWNGSGGAAPRIPGEPATRVRRSNRLDGAGVFVLRSADMDSAVEVDSQRAEEVSEHKPTLAELRSTEAFLVRELALIESCEWMKAWEKPTREALRDCRYAIEQTAADSR